MSNKLPDAGWAVCHVVRPAVHPSFLTRCSTRLYGTSTGWKMAHDAIRFDMDNFLAAIRKTKEQVREPQAVSIAGQ